jgi:DNA-directed RNA polymerase subunit RPC12/RpoP
MVEDLVILEFSGVQGSAEGIKCPKCGRKYLLEETVREKVFPAESELSYK